MIRLKIAAILLTSAPLLAAERPARYVARLAGGQRIESDRLTNWHVGNALPQLGGTSLLDPVNHFVWLRNRTRRLADEPQAFVEFTNGDRLPGRVVDYRPGAEEPHHPQPPHLIVRLSIGLEPPENKPVREIRVLSRFVRRIVWQRRDDAVYQGPAAFYRDGRSVALRAVRLKSGEAHVLAAEGDRQLDWDDLAELHMPAPEAWTAWFDQLAAICPTSDTRVLALETTHGLMATASLACFTARFEGNSADPDRWVHGVQPAWSLDILWVPCRHIVSYRSFAPHEIPLSYLPPQPTTHRGGLWGPRNVKIDRSVVGSPLRSGSLDFGWGLGVAGGTELAFDVPAAARSLRTSVCLDRTAGSGGCIRPRICWEDARHKPLWEGPILVGSQQVADAGAIDLESPPGPSRKLLLQIDAMADGRPPGADPLDIRDHADWCDPLLALDRGFVELQLKRRLARRFAAWDDWNVELDDPATDAGVELSLHLNETIPGAFEPAIRTRHRPLRLRREITIGPTEKWLVIAATRISRRIPEPKIEVWIDGQVAGQFDVASGGGDLKDVLPLVVPLAAYQQAEPRRLAIEIRQLPSNDASPVQYWSIALARQIPTLHELLEDDALPRPIKPEQTGEATLVAERPYSGAQSLRLTPDGQFRIELPKPIAVRAAPQWGEGRFLRLAVRKQGGGRLAIGFEEATPRNDPARYDLGRGQPSYGQAVRIGHDPLPDEWVVVTRDLYADFGNMEVQAIIVGCPDGGAAFIDHVYLARSRADFELAPRKVGR